MTTWKLNRLNPWSKECAIGKGLFLVIVASSILANWSWSWPLLSFPENKNTLEFPGGPILDDSNRPAHIKAVWHKTANWDRIRFFGLWKCRAQTYGTYYAPNGDHFDDNEMHTVKVPDQTGPNVGERDVFMPPRVLLQKGTWYWEARVYGSCAPWEFLPYLQVNHMNIKMPFVVN
jgi:hypothetical protein